MVKYIDIPLQHINDRVLKSMHRRVTRQQTEELLGKLRKRIPGVTMAEAKRPTTSVRPGKRRRLSAQARATPTMSEKTVESVACSVVM